VPTITLTLSGQRSPEQTRRIVDEVIAMTSTILDKPFGRTALILKNVPAEDWFIAGKSLAEFGKNAFRVEVTVVDETVTKSQKASYCKKMFELLSQLIENLHPFSNIYVIDVKGAAYGYGGLTQEYAMHHPEAAPFLEI
jgi:4-oxalocrotonate tautomerase